MGSILVEGNQAEQRENKRPSAGELHQVTLKFRNCLNILINVLYIKLFTFVLLFSVEHVGDRYVYITLQ